jgi:LmbE family N-acetylglucosaminyl deacetylase
VETYLISATRGERGWIGDAEAYPGPEALGKIREAELRAAAEILGIRRVDFLDYIDGDLNKADPAEVVAKIVRLVREIRPHVVVTFGHDGAYGHPDHIAICQSTTAALVCAADPTYQSILAGDWPPHRVPKLYYFLSGRDEIDVYEQVVGDLIMNVDGQQRRPVRYDDWVMTSWIDTSEHWPTVLKAISCHRTQIPDGVLKALEEKHHLIWNRESFYRVYSLVNGGGEIETDLFEGLR